MTTADDDSDMTPHPVEPVRRRSYEEWQAARAANREMVDRMLAFFGRVAYVRTRPRGKTKADALRAAGCPPELIGPVVSDEEYDAWREKLAARRAESRARAAGDDTA